MHLLQYKVSEERAFLFIFIFSTWTVRHKFAQQLLEIPLKIFQDFSAKEYILFESRS